MTRAKMTIGFIPLLDCASIVAAVERGFAAAEGLDVSLVRETSWANIRDRVIVGHFDAAHMLGPMAVASSLGVGHVQVPLIAPFSLGLGGNAITVSTALWEQMTREGAMLGANPRAQGTALQKVVSTRARAHERPLTFGMVYPFSCHNYELRYWLTAVGIHPERDVRLVVIPPPYLADSMREGQIDGFCVGEPWNSVAVDAGIGVIALPTSAIWPRSPEKVLGCRASWAESSANVPKLDALLRALHRASLWCENASNHSDLAHMLAAARYVGAPADLLHAALDCSLRLSPASSTASLLPEFFVPAHDNATFPWVSHALWFYEQMLRWQQVTPASWHPRAVRATYRPDIYRRALRSLNISPPTEDIRVEQFFDERVFQPAAL